MQKQIDSLDLLINKLIDESAELSGKAKKLTADAVEVRDSVPYDPINPLKITVALKAWLIQVWLRPAKRDSRVPTAPFWAFLYLSEGREALPAAARCGRSNLEQWRSRTDTRTGHVGCGGVGFRDLARCAETAVVASAQAWLHRNFYRDMRDPITGRDGSPSRP